MPSRVGGLQCAARMLLMGTGADPATCDAGSAALLFRRASATALRWTHLFCWKDPHSLGVLPVFGERCDRVTASLV